MALSSNHEDGDDLLAVHFPPGQRIASPGTLPVSGPWGRSRLAGAGDLRGLLEAGQACPGQFIQLLSPTYAIAHDGAEPMVSSFDSGLPIPMGEKSPNVAFFGRSGSGKTQKGTLPVAIDTIRSGRSLFHINVKGKKQSRFLRRVARAAEREGEFRLLAPLKPERSLGCPLLEGCENPVEAAELARCIVNAAAGQSRYESGAWTYSIAEEWLTAAIAAVASRGGTLADVRQVVLGGSFSGFADAHPSFPALRKFAAYVEGGNQNAQTNVSTLGEVTCFLDLIQPFVSAVEFSFAEFAKKGGIVILEIDEHEVGRLQAVIALIVNGLLNALQREACTSPSGALPHETVLVIDELAASGTILALPQVLHTNRERGYRVAAGIQSVAQVASLYGSNADVVLAGFQTKIAFGGGLDLATAEYLSRLSGTTTIAVPAVIEQDSDDGGGVTVGRSWGLGSRALLLPDDIANPLPHSLLGPPVTVFLGDGTPPFQAYLTATYEVGSLAKLLDEVAAMTQDDDLRVTSLKGQRRLDTASASAGVQPPGISDTAGWTEEQITSKLTETRRKLDWDNTTGSARKWWEAFENENKHHTALVLRLAEELANRRATITEFFLAYIYSNTDNIQANLHYLDYARVKKAEEQARRTAAQACGDKRVDQEDAES